MDVISCATCRWVGCAHYGKDKLACIKYIPELQGEITMPNYITVKQAAKRWGVSPRRVQQYCKQGRIPGAEKKGHDWWIPANAECPAGEVGRPKEEK